jgi:acetyl esterase/lipase
MPVLRRALLGIGLLLAAIPARAQLLETSLKTGAQYGTHDGVALVGDLYAPKAPGKYPAIVAVHGGGWQTGARATYKYWGPYLAQRGYVVFAIDYRLVAAGQKMFPQSIQDVRAAIQFVRHDAGTLNVDPDRIGLLGESAGGQMVALVGLTGDSGAIPGAYRDDPYAGVSAKVKAVVALYGIYDMVQQWNHDQVGRPSDQIVEKYLGVPPMADRKLYFDASPLSYATVANNQVSFLLAWGTEDDIVDEPHQAEPFLLALKQARFNVRTVIMTGAPHGWNSEPLDEHGSFTAILAPKLLRFLAERL